jgi:hypothetical protein
VSVKQHELALRQANDIRLERAMYKRQVRDGDMEVRELLESPPKSFRTLQIFDFIMWQNRWGVGRTRRLFKKLGLSEWLTFGSATERQLKLLIKEF